MIPRYIHLYHSFPPPRSYFSCQKFASTVNWNEACVVASGGPDGIAGMGWKVMS